MSPAAALDSIRDLIVLCCLTDQAKISSDPKQASIKSVTLEGHHLRILV